MHLPVHGVGVGVGAPSQYLPPVFKSAELSFPPQTIIAVLVETAVCCARTLGALVVLVAVQLSVPGLYLPPVFKVSGKLNPPQMIISLPVHTAVCR